LETGGEKNFHSRKVDLGKRQGGKPQKTETKYSGFEGRGKQKRQKKISMVVTRKKKKITQKSLKEFLVQRPKTHVHVAGMAVGPDRKRIPKRSGGEGRIFREGSIAKY